MGIYSYKTNSWRPGAEFMCVGGWSRNKNSKVGLLVNVAMMVARIGTGLNKAYDKYHEKAELVRSIISAYGADFICNNGFSSLDFND